MNVFLFLLFMIITLSEIAVIALNRLIHYRSFALPEIRSFATNNTMHDSGQNRSSVQIDPSSVTYS